MEIQATEIFERTWDFINEFLKDDNGNLVCDDNGKPVRKYRYIIHEGSSRSSKTYSLIQCFFLYALQNKNKRLSVWRDTKKDCKDTVGYDMSQIFPIMPFGKTVFYSESKGIFKFLTSKSVIEVTGTDQEKKVMGYNGDVAWLNEPYLMPRETFDQIDQRTQDFIFIDWNPKLFHWVDYMKKDKRALVIHSTFKNNPFCPSEQKIKILSYQPVSRCRVVESGILTAKEARQYDMVKNKIGLNSEDLLELSRCIDNENKNSASDYNWSVYGLGLKAEKPNRIFNWKQCTLDKFYEIQSETYYGVDWGKVDAFGIVAVKYQDGKLYCRELNYLSENEIRSGLSLTERNQINSDDEEGGLVQWFFEKLGIDRESIIICDPNRKMKIIALRQIGFDNAISAHKPPGSIKDGIDLLDSLDVYYTEESKNIQYEQENYSRKVDRYGVVLDQALDTDNHLMDPIRYVAQFLQMEGIIKIA
jgi:PBSX family phage terminase large subunit